MRPVVLTLLAVAALASAARASSPAAVPVWPSLAHQLRDAHARPGSALAALIAANQDFGLLRAAEAKDPSAVPPWLRVYWRKSHPEGHYDANDATGGYPLVLKEIYEWMTTHQDLQPGPGKEPDGAETEPPAKVAVSGETRISGAQTAPRSESDIRINFWDPQKIIGASNNISGTGSQAQFYSTDGGATWGQSDLPLQSGDAFHSDPTVEWTSDGTAWATTIGINSGGNVLHMRAYKSVDNGATWTFDATFSSTQTSTDKQMIWVDHSATSPYKDNLYAIWHNGLPAFVARRTGPAGSWQAPIQVSGAESTGTAIGDDIKTNASGDVFAFWPTTGNQKIFVRKSTDGGASFPVAPVQIATTIGSFDIGVPAMNSRRALIYVSGAAYRTADKNLVYAAWSDLSGASGCTAAGNEPGSNVASTCKSRVWFSRSIDGGATWSTPVKVNDQASLNDQFNQWLAVDETSGTLSLMYYDTVSDAGRKKVDVWYQSSYDDGQTWTAATKVTSAQTDETVSGADSGNQFGDYNALSIHNGIAFPSWTDRRNNAREEIWTAKVEECTPTGAPAIGAATATAPNQVQVTWGNGSPASTTFDVQRALGTCASPGAFTTVGSMVAGSPFTDSTVSGSTTYAYRVVGRDVTGGCASAPSGCAQVTATGACTLAPDFGGLVSATNDAAESCGVALSWNAGTAHCGGPLTYDVFRSTTAGFTPSPANRIAADLTGTSFHDVAALTSGTAFHYIVRAKDTANGLQETNVTEGQATVTGTITTTLADTFEDASGFDTPGWTHASLTGSTDWARSTAEAQSPTHSWFSAEQTITSDRVLVSPPFTPTAGSVLSFWHTYSFENATSCFDAGTLEISTDGGSTWTVMPDAAFLAGGFTGTVSSSFSNPLGGKRAWCNGTISTPTQVLVGLGIYAGQTVQVRWHEGDDSSVAATGWYVDSVLVASAGVCSAPPGDLLVNGFEEGSLPGPWSGATP